MTISKIKVYFRLNIVGHIKTKIFFKLHKLKLKFGPFFVYRYKSNWYLNLTIWWNEIMLKYTLKQFMFFYVVTGWISLKWWFTITFHIFFCHHLILKYQWNFQYFMSSFDTKISIKFAIAYKIQRNIYKSTIVVPLR